MRRFQFQRAAAECGGRTHGLTDERCRGEFVAPGKFFPPPYCHNETNANSNPNPKFNPILNRNPNPYCCVWE